MKHRACLAHGMKSVHGIILITSNFNVHNREWTQASFLYSRAFQEQFMASTEIATKGLLIPPLISIMATKGKEALSFSSCHYVDFITPSPK